MMFILSSLKLLYDAQLGASATRVARYFGVACFNWLALQQHHACLVPTHAHGYFRWTNALGTRQPKRIFYNAIFEAVKADNGESSTEFQQVNGYRQRLFYCTQFVVYRNAQRLKQTCRRMNAVPA